MTGFRNTNWSLRAIALTAVLVSGLAGVLAAQPVNMTAAETQAPQVRPIEMIDTSNMTLDQNRVIWVHARSQVQWGAAATPRPTPRIAPNVSDSPSNPWVYDHNADPRQGLYDPPQDNEFTSYCYENNSWFRMGTAAAGNTIPVRSFSPPNTSLLLDPLTLGGACSAPPVGVEDLDYCWRAFQGTYDFGILITFWDNFDPNGGFGGNTVSGDMGGVLYNYGPMGTLVGFILCDSEPLPTPVYFDDPDVAVEFDYVDANSLAVASATQFFTLGPARAEPTLPSNAPVGTSDQFFYVDVNFDGSFSTSEKTTFANASTFKGNFFLHIMGFQKPTETEPNDLQITTDAACLCSTRNASIGSAGDVDWVKFEVQTAGDVGATLDCGANDTTMVLRDNGGVPITSNDDISATNLCSEIRTTLGVGTYYLEIKAKNPIDTFPYDLILKPLAGKVTGLKYSTSIVPAPKSVVTWDAQVTGSTYDVVRGNILNLHNGGFCDIDGGTWAAGDFTSACALPDCFATDLATATFNDVTVPTGPEDSLFYLVRAKNACQGVGSYDEGGAQDHPRDSQILSNLSANPCP